MSKAVDKLSIFKSKGSKSSPPTKDHLAPENGERPEQPSPAQSVNGPELKSGGFEKLSAMFGRPGPMFSLPASNGSTE